MNNDKKEDKASILKAELLAANKELAFQHDELEKLTAELQAANKELAFQNEEKGKRTKELLITDNIININEELTKIQNTFFIDKQLFEQTLMSIADAVISTDVNKNVVFINKSAESLTGWVREEAYGKSIYEVFDIYNEVTREKSEDIILDVITSGKIHHLNNHTILVRKDSTEIFIEDSTAPIYNEKHEVVGAVIVFRDYSEKWEQLKNIEYLSYHDELTGLYNRRFFEKELVKLDTKANLPLSLVMGDFNGLKLINDSFGHAIGDKLLKKTANILKRECRTGDIAARLGGDEFAIILPNSNADDAEKVIRRIKKKLSNQKVYGIDMSISFGAETKTDDTMDLRDMFKRTEDIMYRNKIYESNSVMHKTIDLITSTLFAKNRRELIHSQRVSELCEALCEKMGFDKEKTNQIRLTGLMHDIGKIGVGDKILNKPGRLTDAEFADIKMHSEIGYRILSSVNEFSEISLYVLEHHEKWDGTGYPQGLKGEKIKIESRIIALVDSYEAMTAKRTYKEALSKEEAISEIQRCSGFQFDPAIAKIFIDQVLCSQ